MATHDAYYFQVQIHDHLQTDFKMATRRPKFASSEPEVYFRGSNSAALVRKVRSSETRARRPMFPSNERDVTTKACRTRKPSVAIDPAVDLTASLASNRQVTDTTAATKTSAEWPTIKEVATEASSQSSSVPSSRREVVYCNPMLPGDPRNSESFPRRIVRQSHAVKFISPYEKCTLMMQAAARRAEVDRATARKSQLKDFAIRLKCSCVPKKSRPATPVPEDTVLALEPEEKYVGLQSDLFPEPVEEWPYVPAAYCDTQETQVDCGHGQDLEVGDFDQEVAPHLSKLVGTALQQAMWEVVEHNELRVDKERRRRVEAVIAGEKVELTRLRNQDERLVEEKKRRIAQFKEACRLQEEVAVLMQELSTWMPEHPWVELEALEGFKKAGYLLQDIKDSVDRDAMTWIWQDTTVHLDSKVVGRDLLNEMIENICMVRSVIHQIMGRRYQSENAPSPIIGSDTSSGSTDFFAEEWEIKEAGFIDVSEVRRGRKANSLVVDSYISGKTMSETLTEYLNQQSSRTAVRGTLVPEVPDGDTSTMLSWTKAVNFNRDPNKLYGFEEATPDDPK